MSKTPLVNMRDFRIARKVKKLGKAIIQFLPLVLTEETIRYCDTNQDGLLKAIAESVKRFSDRLVAIKTANEFIQAHYTEEALSLRQVAQAVGMGNNNFSTFFKTVTGCGFARSVQKMRITEAKKLLVKDGKLQITDIATEVGFGSYAQFANTFKALAGETPLRYRNARLRKNTYVCQGSSRYHSQRYYGYPPQSLATDN